MLLQVGSKRSRGSLGAEPAQALMTDEEGQPRKKLRTTVPACQFLTVYNHRHTLKQRCAQKAWAAVACPARVTRARADSLSPSASAGGRLHGGWPAAPLPWTSTC